MFYAQLKFDYVSLIILNKESMKLSHGLELWPRTVVFYVFQAYDF